MAKGKYTKDACLELLRVKAAELAQNGENRLPKRSDFDDEKVTAIKAYLGPWPRALEAAGLKEPPPVSRVERNREKRVRAKRRRLEVMKKAQSEDTPTENEPDATENPWKKNS